MVDAARGMAVHEVVDFTRSIAEPAAPPPYARAQAHSKNLPTGVVFATPTFSLFPSVFFRLSFRFEKIREEWRRFAKKGRSQTRQVRL